MTGWNMPPGCNESDIPGNRPEDQAHEALCQESALEELAVTTHTPIGDVEKDLTGDEQLITAYAINKFGCGQHPLAYKDELRFFMKDYAVECLKAAIEKKALKEAFTPMAESAIKKLSV